MDPAFEAGEQVVGNIEGHFSRCISILENGTIVPGRADLHMPAQYTSTRLETARAIFSGFSIPGGGLQPGDIPMGSALVRTRTHAP